MGNRDTRGRAIAAAPATLIRTSWVRIRPRHLPALREHRTPYFFFRHQWIEMGIPATATAPAATIVRVLSGSGALAVPGPRAVTTAQGGASSPSRYSARAT